VNQIPTLFEEQYHNNPMDSDIFLPIPECDMKSTGFGERVDGKLVRKWIKQCEADHASCCSAAAVLYPSQLVLIDVERLRLYELPSETQPKYLALSYIWGGVRQPLLMQANFEQWKAEGSLKEVETPQTIRDAMELTRLIGYRYLWVDALCILQDNESIVHHQISQMHNIYQQADLTIIAADGSDCTHGLSGISTENDRILRHRSYQLPGIAFQRLPLSTRYSLEASPWRTRGWTFQEELCSRRALTVLPELMLFTCPSAVWREDLTGPIGLNASTSQNPHAGPLLLEPKLRGQRGSPLEQRQAIELFQELVKQYRQRSLRRSDDIENAFAGVAGMFEQSLGPVYHGIPENCFDEIIHGCWYWDTNFRRRLGFPSWSWTGWIYSPEHSEAGIQTPKGEKSILVFYKVGSDLKLLNRPPEQNQVTNFRTSRLWQHFNQDESLFRARHLKLQSNNNMPNDLIAFFTSVATLKLRRRYPDSIIDSRLIEYVLVHPESQEQLTSIQLSPKFVEKTGLIHDFIVVACDLDRVAFRLMLVSFQDDIAERVNVTVSNRLVTEHGWLSLMPRKELIVMG
jgi:hypothetical protein